MKLYKLTHSDGSTGGTRDAKSLAWGPGVTHEATTPGEGPLCGPGWIHAYEHTLLAVLHDPIHGRFGLDARLWECETDDESPLRNGQLKLGVRSLTTVREIPLPVVTTEQRVRYAILCAWESLRGRRERWVREWRGWARLWLSGENRSRSAAWSAALSAAAAWSAAAAAAAEAAAEWSAEAAAGAAARSAKGLDLIALAEKAVRDEAALGRADCCVGFGRQLAKQLRDAAGGGE